ncbi:MAG: glycosyltransferase, partial [Pseudomonadota bacterium]
EQILAAREHDRQIDFPIVMVLGPFMKSDVRDRIRIRASRLANITVIDFDNRMEVLTANAEAVVGMCGYNTFCEVMSFDRKALFVPRVSPREEQFIRAKRAQELGLCEMLHPDDAAIPSVMAEKLRSLPDIPRPSSSLNTGCLDGLINICSEVERLSNLDEANDDHSEKLMEAQTA